MSQDKTSIEIPVTINTDDMVLFLWELMESLADQVQQLEKAITKFSGKDFQNFEIRIIDTAALPAKFFVRRRVLAAIKEEIINDINKGQAVPPGVEVIDGKTDQVSSSQDNLNVQTDGSKSQTNSKDDGAQDSSSSSSNHRSPAPKTTVTKSSKKDGGGG